MMNTYKNTTDTNDQSEFYALDSYIISLVNQVNTGAQQSYQAS